MPQDDLYAYPQAGQSAQQQSSDRYECHKWATGQSGFDPTQTGGGVPPDQASSARDNYQRAMSACLGARATACAEAAQFQRSCSAAPCTSVRLQVSPRSWRCRKTSAR